MEGVYSYTVLAVTDGNASVGYLIICCARASLVASGSRAYGRQSQGHGEYRQDLPAGRWSPLEDNGHLILPLRANRGVIKLLYIYGTHGRWMIAQHLPLPI